MMIPNLMIVKNTEMLIMMNDNNFMILEYIKQIKVFQYEQ